jgi:hypothetical protein
MKAKALILIIFFGLAGFSSLLAQGFVPPAEGKAVVYFTRVSAYGGGTSFEYFHNDRYIGVFKGKNYMRYELDPGEQLLWISSENKEFITADLQEGGSYIVMVDIIMGVMKARVGATPITVDDTEKFERAKELILSKAPIVTPQKKIDEMNVKLADFIAEKLQQYNEVWKNEHEFNHISPEMAIPPDAMK